MSKIKILFIDDEEPILDALKRSLRKLPYNMVFEKNPLHALKLLENEEFNIVVSDHKMPGITGTVLFTLIKESYPQIIRILMSGFADMSIMVEAINNSEVFRFIPKPWKNEDLNSIILEAVECCSNQNRTD